MRARFRFWGASYGPEVVTAMLTAFDEAWNDVRYHFYESPALFEAAREKLADAILAAAAAGVRDVGRLKRMGLLAMAAHYRLDPDDFGPEAATPQRINNPRYWTSYSEETRTIAEQMKDPECRRLLMGVSETYAELARRAVAAKNAPNDKPASQA